MTASQHRAEREDQAYGYDWEALIARDINTMEPSRLAYIKRQSTQTPMVGQSQANPSTGEQICEQLPYKAHRNTTSDSGHFSIQRAASFSLSKIFTLIIFLLGNIIMPETWLGLLLDHFNSNTRMED